MQSKTMLKSVLIGSVCALALAGAAIAQVREFNVPAGDLKSALDAYARQSGRQVIYRVEDVRGARTAGAKGSLDADQALARLLVGSGLTLRHGPSGSIAVVREGNGDPNPADPTSSPQTAPPAELGELVVTAQKREERLLDVPVAVTAVSGASMVQRNQLRIQDLAASTPGFTVSPSPSAGGQQMLTIRGISTGFNTNPTVGVTVDDVPFGSSTNLAGNTVPDIDPSDLARVEVLRGPQGTLYGASSMGGLLKFVTVDPTFDRVHGRVSVGLGTIHNGDKAGYSLRASVNVPLSDDLAIRASGFTRRDAGYIDNPVLGIKGLNEAHVSGGRVSALWRPTDDFSVKLSALYQEFKGDGANDANLLPGFGDLEQNYVLGIGGFDRKIQAYSATVNGRIGSVDLTSLTGFNVNDFTDSFDFSYALGGLAQSLYGVSGAPVFTKSRTEKFTQELRAVIPITERVEWLVGGFYTHERSPYSQDVQAVVPATGARVGRILLLDNLYTFAEYAAFSDVTFKLSDSFDIQVGGRQSHIKRTASGSPDSKANAFTYLVTPRLRISPDLMVYGRAASGYRAGGVNTNPDPAVPRTFAPDKTQNYELGLKGQFLDRVLTLDASLYYIDWKGLQLNLLNVSNSQTYTTNVSRAKSQGVEVFVGVRPASGTRISMSGSWSDAVLTRDTGSTAAFGLSGDRLPFSARFAGYVALDQDIPLGDELKATIGGQVNFTGDRVGTFIETPDRARYPSFTTVDLRAAFNYRAWSVDLYANNVGDKRGVLGGGAGTYPPFAFSYTQPRTVGVSLSRTF